MTKHSKAYLALFDQEAELLATWAVEDEIVIAYHEKERGDELIIEAVTDFGEF